MSIFCQLDTTFRSPRTMHFVAFLYPRVYPFRQLATQVVVKDRYDLQQSRSLTSVHASEVLRKHSKKLGLLTNQTCPPIPRRGASLPRPRNKLASDRGASCASFICCSEIIQSPALVPFVRY